MQTLQRPIIENRFLGYNDDMPPQDLIPGEFTVLNNVRVADNKIVKVMGTTVIGNQIANFPANGLGELEILSSNTKYIVASFNGTTNASWYSWNGSGNFSLISGSNVMTNDKTTYFATALNILYGLNGTEVASWDGTTFTKNPSGVPIGYFAIWFHNYLFVARTNANPNRLFWSKLGDPTDWSNVANQFVDINPGDGDQIMGLGILNDELFVFKRDTIWTISGFSGATFTSTTALTQNTNNNIYGYGCIASGSIVATGTDIYFLSFVGNIPHIRSLVKTSFATVLEGGIITQNILGTMKSITLANVGTTQGIYDGRFIKWSFSTSAATLPDTTVELDTYSITKVRGRQIHPFTKRIGIKPQFYVVSTVSGSAVVYFIDWNNTSPYTQGHVLKFDSTVSTDYTGTLVNNITIDVVTRNYMPSPARKCKYKYLYVKYDTGQTSTITVNGAVDNNLLSQMGTISLVVIGTTGLDSFRLDNAITGILGGAGSTGSKRINLIEMVGKMGQIEFTESSNAPISIYDFELYYQPKGLRAN